LVLVKLIDVGVDDAVDVKLFDADAGRVVMLLVVKLFDIGAGHVDAADGEAV
jgi:hypothetical protein